MKRCFPLMILLLMLPVVCALGESGSLSTAMDAPVFRSCALTAEEWTADAEHRALLTAVCWVDYSRLKDVEPCPKESLSGDTLVADYKDGSFLFVVIPVQDGRLTFYCMPQYGQISYMWEGGDYSADVKQTALEERGMTVYRNEADAVVNALAVIPEAQP